MKVLVIGSTGFIGRNMVIALQREGYEVVGRSRATGLDMRNPDSVRRHLKEVGPDAIICLAAHVGSVHYGIERPATIVDDNMRMTLNLYQAAAEICPRARMINTISNCSYPEDAKVQREEEWWNGPVHLSALAYGSTRRMTYVVAMSYKQQFNMCSKNFILPGIYGPGDHVDTNRVHALDGMIIRMIKAKRQGDPEFEIWGTGRPVREWCYIDDVVRVIMRGLTIEEDLVYPLNIGQNKGYTIRESAEMIAEAVGYTGRIVFNTEYPEGAAIKILSNERFRKLFPDPVFMGMKEGIRLTVRYYEQAL